MQLKYNRQQNLGSWLFKFFIKLLIAILIFIVAIFLIEKITFPSPKKKIDTDITNEIKKL
jgi:flagellar biogenesis protein FliO